MVYALVLGTSVERHASSSLALGTKISGQWPVFSCQKRHLMPVTLTFEPNLTTGN